MFTILPLKIFVLIVFLISYLLIIFKKTYSLLIVYTAIVILLIFRAITIKQTLFSINLNVLGVFLGTMVLSSLFIYSGVPALLAARLASKSNSVGMALLAVCALSGFISTFTENVATVLIVAPIALEIAKAVNINPVPLLIGVALSANLQGTATMIGDSPSIILALESGMNFNDFFWMSGKPGIFFAVELGAIGSFYFLYRIFKKYHQRPGKLDRIKVKSWFPTIVMVLMVLSLVISSFFNNRPYYTIMSICLFWGLVGLVWHEIFHKESISLVKNLDWQTFFFLIGIFILVGSLNYAGIINDVAFGISKFAGNSPLFAYSLIVWLSVLISAFVDNIPYTIAMIPVAKIIAFNLGVSPYPYLFGLLIGTCLGGNITPIGASCNVVTMGLLRKEGFHVDFREFVKIGLPFTLIATAIGSTFIWLVWGK